MIARGHSFSGQERNCVFLNIGSKQFADASAVALLDFPDDGRAIALTDWDHDGDLDVWLANRNAPQVRMMRNDLGQGNPAVAIQLRGVGSNRDGIGARVQVELREGEQVRQLVETVRAGKWFSEPVDEVVALWHAAFAGGRTRPRCVGQVDQRGKTSQVSNLGTAILLGRTLNRHNRWTYATGLWCCNPVNRQRLKVQDRRA